MQRSSLPAGETIRWRGPLGGRWDGLDCLDKIVIIHTYLMYASVATMKAYAFRLSQALGCDGLLHSPETAGVSDLSFASLRQEVRRSAARILIAPARTGKWSTGARLVLHSNKRVGHQTRMVS